MDVREVRLKLTQQALDRGLPTELIPRVVEPLAQYIVKGVYLKESPPKKP